MQGRPQMTVGAVLEQSRVAQDAPPRDASAPWGSELNPALLLDGRVIEPTPLARSAGDEQLLAKARALRGDLVRYRRQRRGGMRSITRAATIGRSESCVWCTQENLSDEQSYLLHSDPQWNVPVTPPGYFDADEEPAGRTSSGLGWPEIYR
jgi:hypothetical protein